MGFVERLEKLDRRIIYWFLFAIIALLYIRPLGLPLIPSQQTKDALPVRKTPSRRHRRRGIEC